MTRLERMERIDEVLKTGTDLETFKKEIFELIPEFKELDIPHDQPAHQYDIITHTYYVVQGVSDNKYVKLAALFHDIGKPVSKFLGEDGVYHYWGHPEISYKMTRMIMTYLGYQVDTVNIVSAMVKYHDTYINQSDEFFDTAIKDICPENLKYFCELQTADLNAHTKQYANKHKVRLALAHANYDERIKNYL